MAGPVLNSGAEGAPRHTPREREWEWEWGSGVGHLEDGRPPSGPSRTAQSTMPLSMTPDGKPATAGDTTRGRHKGGVGDFVAL